MSRRLSKNKRQCIAQYGQRNTILRRMGFVSYADYLDSPLWKSIRGRVLERDGHRCCGCSKPATEVHHLNYTKANLAGVKLDHMSAICHKCHRFIEFDRKHRKLSPAQANKKLKHRHRKSRGPFESKRQRRKKNHDLWQSGDPLHAAYRDKVNWIKANLTGRKRDTAIATAIRERSAQINSRHRWTGCQPTYSQPDQSVPWDRTQGVGAGEQSPAVANGKPQSNAARTQGPPIHAGHRPGNTPPIDKLAPSGA